MDVYLYKDFGASYFDGLDIDFELEIDSDTTQDGLGGVGLSNTIGNSHIWSTSDLAVMGNEYPGPQARIYLYRTFVAVDNFNVSFNTLYYCTLSRAGGSGTVTVLIYDDSGRTNLLDTLTVAGYGANKWRYLYGFVNRNSGGSGEEFDGYVQNMTINPPPAVAPTVTTQAVADIDTTTATGHGNITATGGENPHTRGICWNIGGTPTTGDSKSEDNGGGSYGTGAFSKAMTGLTPGQLYYVRAYAINSIGTGYGNEVNFTTLSVGVAKKSANMAAKMMAAGLL